MNLPTQIMALVTVKHAELNSWIFLLNALQKFCSFHQGTAKPPIQVELATFGQKSGRCEVSALVCLKLPGVEMLKSWWIGNIKGQKRLIKRIKVLNTHRDLLMSIRNWKQNYRIMYCNVYNLVCGTIRDLCCGIDVVNTLRLAECFNACVLHHILAIYKNLNRKQSVRPMGLP